MWYNKFNPTQRALLVIALISLASLMTLMLLRVPGAWTILLFYLVLACFCLSTLTLVNFYIRRLLGQREFQHLYFATALRQSLWLSLIVIFSLLLSSHGLFSWINTSFLILVFVFLESYLITKNG
ncbi:MAG: hypothetical protein A3J07_02820 [Candidatus Doudnabacteria bacterium RIFCSPLOWO2_02_FULL_49_13]|uniref:Uncharacterized protein n=1 Tax=Candidatus Doudnabacteria bacterium RIFCSPHIGHO2_12_FULL_48_16 TaxID=1817838 RepID=A0A1F5PLQ7_9BACT|nr:MAG: hypothetical protein A3B77_01460 [Candidatus Doudnabacteria bacterium RIFCSPHIGHO2_02_FULL_49_24]OGE88107.1 MAG: hypothetical protein A2760_00865 [Candidatus Doudnabacteria bacterium RIFCSPHIGHO2_01_FULL_50_67]OGE90610.1 MAG: hypothetical protein A3E29_02330 [Candidatus Doudnabacteria bacterium RIFCSPHIGHO2_12_FULL_48_16]OGE96466.1 MAG: hypothetical protein A2990_04265 [Candidatus Doudnabacteria bacterium RIFCSPLOWO2_01_FULL_49_40]OGF03003.1 MAG: hypothetical protein A3J07_02820 [Candid